MNTIESLLVRTKVNSKPVWIRFQKEIYLDRLFLLQIRNGRKIWIQWIHEVHKLLKSCFNQAVKWDIMEKNPAFKATVPKHKSEKRVIWDAETFAYALDVCENECLKLCMNLAFAGSLRIGELLGLTWDCVDISEEEDQRKPGVSLCK